MATKSESPLLYGELDEWKDLIPIAQEDEGFAPLAPILYSDEYKDATGYFRAIVKKGEHSRRVLDLTEHIIRLNPSHYSVWQYRYDTLLAIDADLEAELKLMDDIATKFLKTYQVWHHRRLLVSRVRKLEYELEFVAQGLKEVDPKNYHTWAYRQWILSNFNEDSLWAGELSFVEDLLRRDIRNNSAWHHRFFVVWDSGVRSGETNRDEILARELSFVKQKISIAPNNPSAWNYLRGVLEFTSTPFSSLHSFTLPYTKPRTATGSKTRGAGGVEPPIDLDNPPPALDAELPIPYAIEFLGEILEMVTSAPEAQKDGEDVAVSSGVRAGDLYASLAREYDPVRHRYWEFRQRKAEQRHSAITANA